MPMTSSRRCWRWRAARPSRRSTRCRPTACAGSTFSASTNCAGATCRRRRAGSTCTAAPCSASWPSAHRASRLILLCHNKSAACYCALSPCGRKIWKRHERPADVLAGVEILQHLALLVVAGKREDIRNTGQLGARLGAGLQQHIDGFVGNPVGFALVDAVEALTDAVDLATL